MLSLVLFPYVYLLTRSAFLNQSLCVLDVSRTLGNSPWRTFFTVALPLARPAIVAGLSLALMETLADYGTVQYFGVATFTTGIFRIWFGMDSAAAAAQLSTLLLRPDDIIHDDDSPLKLKVVGRVFQGAAYLYTLQLPDGNRVFSLVQSHHDHRIGESIGVRPETGHLVVFSMEPG